MKLYYINNIPIYITPQLLSHHDYRLLIRDVIILTL